MIRIFAALMVLISVAHAQPVQQSGTVTPGHGVQWLTTGVIADSGGPPTGNPSITIGTTQITSGTNKGLLYDNNGVVGNLSTLNNGILVTDGSGNPSISTTLPSGININITIGVTNISSGTNNGLLYDNNGLFGNLATGNNGVLVTSGSGVPSISTTLPSGLTIPSPSISGATLSSPTFTGTVTFPDSSTWTSSGPTINGTALFTGPVQYTIAQTLVSATALNWRNVYMAPATTTITGNTGTPITKMAAFSLGQQILTDSSSVTVTDAATFYIDNAPNCSGSVTCTNAWSLLIGNGNAKIIGTLTLDPVVNTTNKGFSISQTGPATGVSTASFNYNGIAITDQTDNSSGAAGVVSGLKINIFAGGTSTAGGVWAGWDDVTANSAGTANSGDMIGRVSRCVMSASYSSAVTGCYGANPQGILLSGAVLNSTSGEVAGMECDSRIDSGASAAWHFGCGAVNTGAESGSVLDAAFEVGGSSAGWENAFLLNSGHGNAPLTTGGCVICTDGVNDTIATGIDLSAYTISGNFLHGGTGFYVSGAGQMLLGKSNSNTPVQSGVYLTIDAQSGVAAPSVQSVGTLLQLVGANASSNFTSMELDSFANGQSSGTYGNVILGLTTGGTLASPSATPSGAYIWNLNAYGYDGTNYASGASINIETTALWATGGSATRETEIIFQATPASSTTKAVQMIVQSGVLIGASGTQPGAGKLAVTSLANTATTSALCYNTSSGLFSYDSTIGTCNTSDERLKHFDHPFVESTLDKLIQIADSDKFGYFHAANAVGRAQFGSTEHIGIGAQTVAKYFPELTAKGDDGLMSLAYDKLTVPIIEALAELKADNDNLRAEVESLRKRASR